MDLSSLDTRVPSETGVEMELLHPSTYNPIFSELDGKTINFKIVGLNSASAKDALEEVLRINASKNENRKQRRRNQIDEGASDEQADKAFSDLLCSLVLGWSDNFQLNGRVPQYPDDLEEVMSVPIVRDQVWEFVKDRGNFLPERSSSLQSGSKSRPGLTQSQDTKESPKK